MKKLAVPLVALVAVLSGCVAYPSPPPEQPQYGYRDRDRDGFANRYDRDRDNDGVPNRHDRRPDNPRRY